MHLLFDLDGTLTDPGEGILACLRHAYTAVARPCPEHRELLGFIGPPLQQSFLKTLGDPQLAATALLAYRERYGTLGMFENTVYPGAVHALERFQALGLECRVATSKPEVFAKRILEHFGLARYFKAIFGAELSGERSQKADLIAYILEREQLNRHATLMIGDRLHDIVAAREHGLGTVGVTWGYGSREELTQAGADTVVDTFEALVAHVEQQLMLAT